MSNILDIILKKLGKSSSEELRPLGRETYYQYRRFLEQAEKGITIQMFYDFKKKQREQIVSELGDPSIKLNDHRLAVIQAKVEICSLDIAMLESPKVGVEMLEKRLKEIHNIK